MRVKGFQSLKSNAKQQKSMVNDKGRCGEYLWYEKGNGLD